MLKLKMMLCVMMFTAGRRQFATPKRSVSRCVYTASGVDNAASPTGEYRRW